MNPSSCLPRKKLSLSTLIFLGGLFILVGCNEPTSSPQNETKKTVEVPIKSLKDRQKQYDQSELTTKFTDDAPTLEGFQPQALLGGLVPITEIQTMPATKVTQDRIPGDELVLGVKINGESRAYPIAQLCGPKREIINDRVGGQAIAATW